MVIWEFSALKKFLAFFNEIDFSTTLNASKGMDVLTFNGIDVPKWRYMQPLDTEVVSTMGLVDRSQYVEALPAPSSNPIETVMNSIGPKTRCYRVGFSRRNLLDRKKIESRIPLTTGSYKNLVV